MKLYFMRSKVLEDLKNNMTEYYLNYYQKDTNDWIYELFDNPFEYFTEIPDFELADTNLPAGRLELENSRIMYSALHHISESQAADERLWAGLCNGPFYSYVRKRHKYPSKPLRTTDKDTSAILSRFFFSGGIRSGSFRNTLAKLWWVGRANALCSANGIDLLDAFGEADFSSKINDIFYSYTFSSNKDVLTGICMALKFFKEKNISLVVKDHIRPAMQQLNALGGAVLLDMYSSDEIKSILIENITNCIYSKDNSTLIYETDDEIDDETDNYSSEFFNEAEEVKKNIREINPAKRSAEQIFEDTAGMPDKVSYGHTVKFDVLVNGKEEKTHSLKIIKTHESEMPMLAKRAIGKSVGDEISILKGTIYKIKEIHW